MPFTAEQEAILVALPKVATLAQACREVQVPRSTAYHWMANDPAFAGAVVRAKEEGHELLEAEVYRRAYAAEGKMPDVLAMFLLKGAYPDRFRDNVTVKHQGAILHANLDLNALDPADRAQLLALAVNHEQNLLPTPADDGEQA